MYQLAARSPHENDRNCGWATGYMAMPWVTPNSNHTLWQADLGNGKSPCLLGGHREPAIPTDFRHVLFREPLGFTSNTVDGFHCQVATGYPWLPTLVERDDPWLPPGNHVATFRQGRESFPNLAAMHHSRRDLEFFYALFDV